MLTVDQGDDDSGDGGGDERPGKNIPAMGGHSAR